MRGGGILASCGPVLRWWRVQRCLLFCTTAFCPYQYQCCGLEWEPAARIGDKITFCRRSLRMELDTFLRRHAERFREGIARVSQRRRAWGEFRGRSVKLFERIAERAKREGLFEFLYVLSGDPD